MSEADAVRLTDEMLLLLNAFLQRRGLRTELGLTGAELRDGGVDLPERVGRVLRRREIDVRDAETGSGGIGNRDRRLLTLRRARLHADRRVDRTGGGGLRLHRASSSCRTW